MIRRRAAVLSLLVLVTGAAILGPAGATAQTAGGSPDRHHVYVLSGTSTGVSIYYDREALLPLSPIFDTGFPRSTASIDDTPSASGRGSPADPGIVGAAGAIGPQLGVPAGLIPTYPLYADATYPAGPASAEVGNRQDVPLGGGPLLRIGSGAASASENEATAEGRIGRADLDPVSIPFAEGAGDVSGALRQALAPLLAQTGAKRDQAADPASDVLVSIGSGETEVHVRRDGERLVARVTSRLSGVSLLGGVITMDGLTSTTTLGWAAPGAEPKLATATDVSRARLLGVPIRFTDEGFEFSDSKVPFPLLAAVRDAVNAAAGGSGGDLRLGVPVQAENRVGVSAVLFSFDGELVPASIPRPPLPLVGPGERDIFKLGLAGTSLTYVSRYVQFASMDAGGDLATGTGTLDTGGGGGGDVGSGALQGVGPVGAEPVGGEAGAGGAPGGVATDAAQSPVELITAAGLTRISAIAVIMLLGALAAGAVLTAGRFRLLAR